MQGKLLLNDKKLCTVKMSDHAGRETVMLMIKLILARYTSVISGSPVEEGNLIDIFNSAGKFSPDFL
jgi:hypothetical protein